MMMMMIKIVDYDAGVGLQGGLGPYCHRDTASTVCSVYTQFTRGEPAATVGTDGTTGLMVDD